MWFLIIVLGIAGQIGAMFAIQPFKDQIGLWILLIVSLPLIVAIAIGIWVTRRIHRARVHEIGEALEWLGFEVETQPSPATRERFAPTVDGFARQLALRDGIANVDWIGFRDDAIILEHRYVVGTGKATQERVQTVVAWTHAAPDLPSARLAKSGSLLVTRPYLGEASLLIQQFGNEFVVGDDVFDKQWLLFGDETLGREFLSAEVIQHLMACPRGTQCSIGNGWIALGFRRHMDAPNLVALFDFSRVLLGGSAQRDLRSAT